MAPGRQDLQEQLPDPPPPPAQGNRSYVKFATRSDLVFSLYPHPSLPLSLNLSLCLSLHQSIRTVSLARDLFPKMITLMYIRMWLLE